VKATPLAKSNIYIRCCYQQTLTVLCGENYPFWKIKMQIFFKSVEIGIWKKERRRKKYKRILRKRHKLHLKIMRLLQVNLIVMEKN